MQLIGTVIVCAGILWGIDDHWFGGMYFDAICGMANQIKHNF